MTVMARWDKHDKYAVLIASVFSIILALCILRNFIVEPGLVESGDIYFPYRFDDEPQYVWNRFLSSTHVPYHQIIFSWLTPLVETGAWIIPFSLVSASIETLQRALWSLFITLISFISFITVFKYTRTVFQRPLPCYAASMLASFLYTFNPYVVGIMQWWPNLLSYAFLPAFFYLIPVAINHPTWTGTIKIGLVAALLLALNFCSPGAALNTTVFLLFLIIIEFVFKLKKDFVHILLRCSVLFIEILGLALLLNTYAIVPFSLFQEEFTWGGQGIPLQVEGLYGEGGANIQLIDAFRLWKWSETGWFNFTSRPLLTLVVPLIAISALILFTIKLFKPNHLTSLKIIDKKMITTLILLMFLALFLAKGINDPFGNFYIWLVFSTPFSWLFEHSEVWIRYLCLSYTLLCALLLAQLINRIHPPSIQKKIRLTFFSIKKQIPLCVIQATLWIWNGKIALFLVGLIVFSVVVRTDTIAAYPSGLFLGTANDLLVPSPLPQPYYKVNDWLTAQSGEFRTIWLPIEGRLTWWRYSGPLHHPIGDWASSRPIATTNHPSQKDYMMLTLNYLKHEDTFAELLGLFNIKYIINHLDVEDSDDEVIYELLKENSALTQIHNEDFLYVFENYYYRPYVQALLRPLLCVGNPRVLDFASTISSFNLSTSAVIFPEQLPGLGLTSLTQLPNNTILLFYNKHFIDLLFNSLRGEYIYTPVNYLRENLHWRVEDRRDVMNYEFDYGKGYVYSLEKRPFKVEIEVQESNQYEIWVRVLGRQTLTIQLDEFIHTETSAPLDPLGFTWVYLGTLNLTEGKHEFQIINEQGWGNLNLIMLAPKEELRDKKELLLDYINNQDIRIVHLSQEKAFEWTKSNQIRFHESFENSSTNIPPWLFNGNWTIFDNQGTSVLSQLNETHENAIIKVGNNMTMHDGVFEVDINLRSGSIFGLIRKYGPGQSYIFSYTDYENKLIIWKTNGRDTIKLGEADFTLEKGKWYTLMIDFQGSKLSLYVNGIRYITASDDKPPYAYTSGQIYFTTSNTKVDFDNITLWDPLQALEVFTPKESEYILALSTVERVHDDNLSIHIDEIEYNLFPDNDFNDSEWRYILPIKLSQDNHRFEFFPSNGIRIKNIILFSLTTEEDTKTVNELFQGKPPSFTIAFERVQSEKCIVQVTTSEPFILAFSETYHSLWRASTDGHEYYHFPLFSQINGFFINKTGTFIVTIEFLPGRAHALGEAISTTTLIFMFISYLFLDDRIRRNLIQSSKKIKNTLRKHMTHKKNIDQ
jgi:hypothetical protein